MLNTRKTVFLYITYPSMPLDSTWVDLTYTPGSCSWALPVWVTIRKSPIELPLPMQALLTFVSCSFSCLELSFSFTGDPFGGLAPRGEAVYLQSLRRHPDHMEYKVPSQACTDNHATRLVIFPFFCLKHTNSFSSNSYFVRIRVAKLIALVSISKGCITSFKDLLIQDCHLIFLPLLHKAA